MALASVASTSLKASVSKVYSLHSLAGYHYIGTGVKCAKCLRQHANLLTMTMLTY